MSKAKISSTPFWIPPDHTIGNLMLNTMMKKPPIYNAWYLVKGDKVIALMRPKINQAEDIYKPFWFNMETGESGYINKKELKK